MFLLLLLYLYASSLLMNELHSFYNMEKESVSSRRKPNAKVILQRSCSLFDDVFAVMQFPCQITGNKYLKISIA